MDDSVKHERQRCLRCVEQMRAIFKGTKREGEADFYLVRLWNQINSGKEPLTLQQQFEPERDSDHRDN